MNSPQMESFNSVLQRNIFSKKKEKREKMEATTILLNKL